MAEKKGKKLTVGILYMARRPGIEEKFFVKQAGKLGINLVLINLLSGFTEKDFEKKMRNCDVIYNNSGEDFAIECLKTAEALGKETVDNSMLSYYMDDKWVMYLMCRENGIPMPETILLSDNLNIAKANLIRFGKWPVVLKKVYGTWGEFVEKADNIDEAVVILKAFRQKGGETIPVIAQEFVKSYSYRVTTIGGKIVQTAVKKSPNWKCTGIYARNCQKFRVDDRLRGMIEKLVRITGINVCGVDLLKRGDDWLVIEVNTVPGLDFINGEIGMLIGKMLAFIKKNYSKKKF